MLEKLIIGTAGLSGEPYGRNGTKVSASLAADIIHHALHYGIDRFDTSPAYGQAEMVLRRTLRGRGEVWTKTTVDNDPSFAAARTGAGVAHVLLHNWKPRLRDRWFQVKLPHGFHGVTTYSHDLPSTVKLGCRYIQCDWNLLNQTQFFATFGVRTGFIARSVFLQGILAGGPVPEPLRPAVDQARETAARFQIGLKSFALRAALEHPQIDYVVVGPQSIAELDQCMNVARWMTSIGTQYGIDHLDQQRSRHTDPRNLQ